MGPVFTFLAVLCAAPPAGVDVRATGGVTAGRLTRLANGAVTLGDGRVVPAGDWYSIRRAVAVLPPWPGRAHLEFGNGDRLAGAVVDADGSALTFRLADGQSLRFPLSALRAVWVRPPGDEPPEWLAGPRRRDVIQSRAGDLALGVIEAIDVAKNVLRYQSDGKRQETEWGRVAAIGFNSDLARVRKPKGPFYRLTLADGSRVSVASVEFDGTAWKAETLHKGSIQFPFDRVVSVDVEQGKAIYLSDQKPTRFMNMPFDGEDIGWTADRNFFGRPIRLNLAAGEATFDRGLGLHSECALTYTLGGKYRRFETVAGLDSRDGRLGDVELDIQVDGAGRELAGAGHLSPAHGPFVITLDVTGAKELRITVRRRLGGNVQDVVNLAEARLVP